MTTAVEQQDQQAKPLCLIYRHKHWALIKASGARIQDYLQSQISQDIQLSTAQQAIYAAVLTPQGKIISELYLWPSKETDCYQILCPKACAEALLIRLRQFSLGYQLRMGILHTADIISVQGSGCEQVLRKAGFHMPEERRLAVQEAQGVSVLSMPEAADKGYFLVKEEAMSLQTNTQEEAYTAACIIHGKARFMYDWQPKDLPLNANLVENGGVSFDKGCYTGQEVSSRMHWRKLIKYRLIHLRLHTHRQATFELSLEAKKLQISSLAKADDGYSYAIARAPISLELGRIYQHDELGSVEVLGLAH